MAESLFAGTLNPITQIWTEDYLNRHAPNIEFYATDGRGYSIEKSRNTRHRHAYARLQPRVPAICRHPKPNL